jgi:hypothetical protein
MSNRRQRISFDDWKALLANAIHRKLGGRPKFFPSDTQLRFDYREGFSVSAMAGHYVDVAIDKARVSAGLEAIDSF